MTNCPKCRELPDCACTLKPTLNTGMYRWESLEVSDVVDQCRYPQHDRLHKGFHILQGGSL